MSRRRQYAKKKKKPVRRKDAGQPTNPKLSDAAILRSAQQQATRALNSGRIIGRLDES